MLNCYDNSLLFIELECWRVLTQVYYLLRLPWIRALQRRWLQRRLFRIIKEELLATIYHLNNPELAQDTEQE